jgi:hypothetical protein
MSACRRKYSELGIVQIPCALPCNAQRFVRFLIDINFFGGNVDPSARRCGDRRGGCESAGTAQGSAPTTRSVGAAFDQVGFQERKVPGT